MKEENKQKLLKHIEDEKAEIIPLKEELFELNKTIHELEDQQVLARTNIALGEECYANEKLVLINNISLEKDDAGKLLYSNETKRQVAFTELMATGHPLQTLKAQLKEDHMKVEYCYNELGFLKRKFQILLLIKGDGGNNNG